jgi:regulatory protein
MEPGKIIKQVSPTTKAILHFCKYRERCHQEVRDKLYELGCTTPEVEQQIAELIANGTVNEERYARAFARGHFRMKQWGRDKIRYELKRKKISPYCIAKAMTEIDGDEYDAVIDKLIDKKLPAILKERSKALRKGKLYRYLAQKGYEKDIILDKIKKYLAGD